MNTKPKAIVLAGYGLNCEEETAFAFTRGGISTDVVHLADLIEHPTLLNRYQILAIPGGFSFGDHTGSGRAYANKLTNHLADTLRRFTERDTLTLGICNGFQILVSAGILPGALVFNDVPRYQTRWVDLSVSDTSPWLADIGTISLPIAHGEGKYVADDATLDRLEKEGAVPLRYMAGELSEHFDLPANPNGSLRDIAGVTAHEGRVLGMMPHPERAVSFTQLPHWTYLREQYVRAKEPLPQDAAGITFFRNAARYFS